MRRASLLVPSRLLQRHDVVVHGSHLAVRVAGFAREPRGFGEMLTGLPVSEDEMRDADRPASSGEHDPALLREVQRDLRFAQGFLGFAGQCAVGRPLEHQFDRDGGALGSHLQAGRHVLVRAVDVTGRPPRAGADEIRLGGRVVVVRRRITGTSLALACWSAADRTRAASRRRVVAPSLAASTAMPSNIARVCGR